MTFLRLLLRNLVYHRRGNFAVFLGVALGTAVLTGALLVGDSLRGSLRALALERLGWVDEAMVSGRFFRAELAGEIPGRKAAPAILLQGSAAHAPHRATKVTLLAVDERFWPADALPLGREFWQGDLAEVVLNAALARVLHAQVGDSITIHVQKADGIPRESLLGKRKAEDVLEALTLTVKHILTDEGMARFTLKPSPEPVRNAFVPLRLVQEKLDLAGRANALLIGGAREDLQKSLRGLLTLDDWNLRLRTPAERASAFVKLLDPRGVDQGNVKKVRWNERVPEELEKQADGNILSQDKIVAYFQKHRNYLNLESRQMFLDPVVEKAALDVVQAAGKKWRAVLSLVYLADSLSAGKKEIPYAVVAGLEPGDIPISGKPLSNNEIVLAGWEGSPLQPHQDDVITLAYFAPDDHNQLQKITAHFFFRGTVPLQGALDDPDVTPEFPGITDKLSMASWENPPFPYDGRRVKATEENYWKRYRTTPKAYVTLDAAQRLWGSRFGNLTSLRLYPGDDGSAKDFGKALIEKLEPERGGFVFQPVKELALKAGSGTTDFGEYFLYFSFFLIVAALLLVGLLFRLNLDHRAAEMGVLLATGWSHVRVRRLLLGEGAALAVVGGLAGLAAALLYADGMLKYLRARWPGGEGLAFLRLHAEPSSFAIGYAASLVVSWLTIVWATRVLTKLPPRALLAGETTIVSFSAKQGWRFSLTLLLVSLLGAAFCVVMGMVVQGHAAQAFSFFGSGAFLLTAGLTGIWRWLKHSGRQITPQFSVGALGVRNAGRHPVRSLLTAGLLAAATFLIVAVESFHRETGRDFYQKDGGSGGFPLLAESDLPFFEDLNDGGVRANWKLPEIFAKVRFYPCRVRAGDDTSCLNLYQPLRPRLLSVAAGFVQRGGFHFSAGLWTTPEEEANPWLLLEKPTDDHSIPVFADASTAKYILKVSLGGHVKVPDDRGKEVKLKIVGLLQESIFQSELVLADANFRKLFPSEEGFSFFLIDSPKGMASAIQSTLEKALGDQGLSVSATAERLEAYLAVENTYLATFQALGGLGLLLGAAGLAIVLLRGVWERRGELALLRALGFRKPALVWLVLAENLFLLLAGLSAGTGAALVAVAPHLAGAGAEVLWLRLVLLLGLVVAVGLAAGFVAALGTLRTPVLTALRRE